MPLYNFECECGEKFEELCKFDDIIKCPKCNQELKKLPTKPKFSLERKIYKAFLNAEDERAEAEEKSHMGKMPYNPLDETEI